MNKSDGFAAEDLILYLNIALPHLPEERVRALVAAYSESWRTYHYFAHILNMIEGAEVRFRHKLSDIKWRMLLCMILYHDVVYKLGQEPGWNERESANYFARDLNLAQEGHVFESTVWAGIYATATHTLDGVPQQYHQLVAMLLDLDLAGLGSEWVVFSGHTEAVWGEYQTITARDKFDEGRALWATEFLKRPMIYHTTELAWLEPHARNNLGQLIGLWVSKI